MVERYVDTWSYTLKGTPVESLVFDISIFRSPTVAADASEKRLVARRRFIPWAQKVFSPKELVQMYNGVHSAQGAGSTAEDQLRRLLEPLPGTNADAKMKAYLEKNVTREEERRKKKQQQQQQQQQQSSENGAAAAAAATAQDATAELEAEAAALAQKHSVGDVNLPHVDNASHRGSTLPLNYHVFTRPPAETFMHPIDRFSEVIPAQPMTDLCASVLRLTPEQRAIADALSMGLPLPQHVNTATNAGSGQQQHQDDDNAQQRLLNQQQSRGSQQHQSSFAVSRAVPTACTEKSMFFVLSTGGSSQPIHGAGATQGLSPRFEWRGSEEVLMQMVRVSDGTLITRPSLLDEHVVHVDESYVISFVVNLAHRSSDGSLALVDAADKHQWTRRSVLVDPEDEDGDGDASNLPSPVRDGRDGGGAAAAAARVGSADEQSERRWHAVRSNVVQRGVVMEMAKRAQSPSAPDASGKVGTVRMLRQALGVHDPPRMNSSSNSNQQPFKSGAEIFAPKRAKDIVDVFAQQQQDGAGAGGNNNNATKVPSFTPLPPPGTKRAHWFITLDSIVDIERESVFARCTWILPPAGVMLDSDVDRKCGVREVMQLTTQTAFASRFLGANMMYTTKHVLNVPLELHCLMNDVTPGTPRLVIEVFSGGDGIGHQTLEGYALVTCSPVPGMQKLRVDMWRPDMSGWEMLKSIFVGGSAALVDREAVALPYGQLANEALNLDATVRREVAEHLAVMQLQQRHEQQLQALPDDAVADRQQLQQQQQAELLQRMQQVAPMQKLPPEIEQDIALASSVACHSRAGLLTTSEGSIDVQIMCFVQQC